MIGIVSYETEHTGNVDCYLHRTYLYVYLCEKGFNSPAAACVATQTLRTADNNSVRQLISFTVIVPVFYQIQDSLQESIAHCLRWSYLLCVCATNPLLVSLDASNGSLTTLCQLYQQCQNQSNGYLTASSSIGL
mgnify:CR=1 FL=1